MSVNISAAQSIFIRQKLMVPFVNRYSPLCTRLQRFNYASLRRTLVRFVRYSATKNKNITGDSFQQHLAIATALTAIVLLLSSCEKVIDVELNDAGKKYVIEGVVTNQGTCRVQISQTVNFSDASLYPPISGAIVTVKDDNGLPITLLQTSPGTYETGAITGTAGHTYNLSVSINGEVFTAASQMPLRVAFDSLFIEKSIRFGDAINLANVVYNDPPGKGNYYRFVQYKNGRQNSVVFIRNDDFTDGNTNTTTLRAFGNNNDDDNNEDELKTGDSVRVEMQCIDAAVYKYWYSLNQGSTGSNNNATPGNPVSNINNGALGYFSAHTVQEKTTVVR